MKRSLLSAVAGLIAGALLLATAFTPFNTISDWALGFVVYLMYGAALVAVVWLCLLWPLYVRVPSDSLLWRPTLCIPVGVVSGALIYFVLMRLVLRFPTEVLLSTAHLLTGAVVGAVTCAVGCYLKREELTTRAV